MNRDKLAPDEYYHVCGRGNLKQDLFLSDRDYLRFLFNILHLQSDKRFYNISRYVDYYQEDTDFCINKNDIDEILSNRNIELAAFCLMPNHYHLILKNISDRGISLYMQRILTGYSRYFHTKHDTSGHVFDGPYNLIHVSSDEQMRYLFSYVHKNPKELTKWKGDYTSYPWSSCQDFTYSRWGDLLEDTIITNQFDDYSAYKKFLMNSSAKDGFELPAI